MKIDRSIHASPRGRGDNFFRTYIYVLRIGLDWIGLDWIGLCCVVLDWIGLDWIGLYMGMWEGKGKEKGRDRRFIRAFFFFSMSFDEL